MDVFQARHSAIRKISIAYDLYQNTQMILGYTPFLISFIIKLAYIIFSGVCGLTLVAKILKMWKVLVMVASNYFNKVQN